MLRKPSPLAPGATLGIIAPGSAPLDADALARGVALLEARGYRVVRGRPSYEAHGYLSGSDAERLGELNRMLRRDDVDALFSVRGGYGCLRLLDGIDYEAARAHPKLLVGYSDVTALQLALLAHARWPSLSGPMVAVEWPKPDPNTEAMFWALARGHVPSPLLSPSGDALTPLQDGQAEGPLIGGNLTVLTRLLGTPYLPPLSGALLFIEEVGEAPYRVDGLLAHLRLAGVLQELGGLIIGGFTECTPQPGRPSLTLGEVFRAYAPYVPGPVALNLSYGHFPIKNTIPIGVQAKLQVDGDNARLHLLEAVTCSVVA